MKLTGIKVVDLSLYLPGPYLTQAMADHGAEVIKIEPPGGDPIRYSGEMDGDRSVLFNEINRGKSSVVLDLKKTGERNRLYQLVKDADVFVESFRPGVACRLGADYETLFKLNPRLVYCSVSAFGQTGPYRHRPAHDLVIEAMSGVVSLTSSAEGWPALPGLAAADILAASQGLSGILMALLRRAETGLGDYVDISMLDSLVAALPNRLGSVFSKGVAPVVGHARALGGAALYRIYETADGRFLVLGGQEEKFAKRLLDALKRPEFLEICRLPAGEAQLPAVKFFEETFKSRTLREWVLFLEPLDICFAPVNSVEEVFEDKHLCERGMFVAAQGGKFHLGTPIKFLHEPSQPPAVAPSLNEEVEIDSE